MFKRGTFSFRLIILFSVVTMFMATIFCALSYYHSARKENIGLAKQNIQKLSQLLAEKSKNYSDLFLFELHNPEFFKTGQSPYLNKNNNLDSVIDLTINKIRKDELIHDFRLTNNLDSIYLMVVQYNSVFDSLLTLCKYKGLKDWGLEGIMRKYIHNLEGFNDIDQVKILSLRRHEKDYFIRHEKMYIDKLNNLYASFSESIKNSKTLTPLLQDSALVLLQNYHVTFNKIITVDSVIGIHNNTGLINKFNNQGSKLEASVDSFINNFTINGNKLYTNLQFSYWVILLCFICLTIGLQIFLSRSITVPVLNFSQNINDYVNNDFSKLNKMEISKYPYEIKQLYQNFNKLVENLFEKHLEIVRTEKVIKENEVQYREIIDLLPQGIFETNKQLAITYANEAWYKKFDRNKEEISNKLNLLDIIHQSEREKFLEIYYDYNTIQIECKAVTKFGFEFDALIYLARIMADGQLNGLRGIIIDITNNKDYIESLKLERIKALESNKLKSMFLANMSHDIRTPLNAIIGFSSLMASHCKCDQTSISMYYDMIKSNGDQLVNLINDIIDISKIEVGELHIQKSDCNINKILDELYTALEVNPLFKLKDNLVLLLSKDLAGENFVIYTDPYRFKQIFQNLINNALKFTDSGEIEFGYRLVSNFLIEFYVKDTGIGIDEDKISEIFQYFKRGHDESKFQVEGSGLGLGITKNLVNLLGGDIWVKSKPEIGSEFVFTLPFNPVENAQQTQEKSKDFKVPLLKDRKILIAEDSESNYKMLNELLKREKAKTLYARNGLEVIDLCKSNKDIDLILMDLQMPVMNGYETLTELQNLRIDIPVIAQTAYAQSYEAKKCNEAGFFEYIAKPYNINDLIVVIQEALFVYEE
jgi:PAS domain S-box-containing protein